MNFAFLLRLGLAGTIAIAAGFAAAQEPTFKSLAEAVVVPGQYIVKTEPGFAAEKLTIRTLAAGARVIATLPHLGAQIVEIPEDQRSAFESAASAALAMPGVAYVEPVYEVRADVLPNDPRYGEQWGFPKIAAPQAWDIRKESDDIIVAVIDTGVDYLHPDLRDNMWTNGGETPDNGVDDDGNGIIDDVFGANFFPTEATGDPMDDNRHGTHVAGTIGAVTDNNLGVTGTNWGTRIMAVKFLSGNGSGSTAGAIRAIEYAIAMGADIMNNSWGGGGFSRALEDAIRLADSEGILFVAAAGNSNNDNDAEPHYPSSYEVPNVLAVMATDQADAKAGFSSFGAQSVDIAAPGVDILSTVPGGNYDSFNGTSMATPHAAGAAALIWAENPSLTHIDLKERLLDRADEIPGLSGRSVTGARLNVVAAMDRPPPPPPDKPDPPETACASNEHTQVAYEEFFWSDQKRVDQNTNLLSVTFELPERMIVDIAAHTSARRISGSGNTVVRTGVYSQPAPNAMWTGSYRRINFDSPNDDKIVSSNFDIVLPAGKNTVYWKLWISGAMLQLDSGTLVVRGIPCSMGGKLSATVAAEEADITEADPSYRPRTETMGEGHDTSTKTGN